MAYGKKFKVINQACLQISVTFGEADRFIPFWVQCSPILPPHITSPSFNYLSMHSKMMSLMRVHETFPLRLLMTTGFCGQGYSYFMGLSDLPQRVDELGCSSKHDPSSSCHSTFASVTDYAFERSLFSFWGHKVFETVFLSKKVGNVS